MSEKHRRTTSRLGGQSLLFTMLLLALLTALSGCGSGQTDVGQTNGNSVPVSLNISMPRESAATVSTVASRFWAKLQSWFPTPTNAWAQAAIPQLVDLRVDVTDSDQQPLATSTKHFSQPPNSGDSIIIDLDVPVGPDRVFTVSGLNAAGRPFLQGKSGPIALTAGKAVTVPITLKAVGQPTISDPASLPIGVVGTAYSATLTATGGTPPYSWSVTPPLPAKLTFTPGGSTATISGTPQAGTIGATNHTFSVTDSASPTPQTGTRSYLLTIAPPGLAIATSSLPNGTVTLPYNATVTASGGTPPYSWSIVGGLTPAPGLSLSSGGAITGTPTDAGTFTQTYRVQDSKGDAITKILTLSVSDLKITTTALPPGTCDNPYNTGSPDFGTVTLSATGGLPPYTWTVFSDKTLSTPNEPAPGVRMEEQSGQIIGILESSHFQESHTRTYRVKDSNDKTDLRDLTISVHCQRLG